VRLAGNPLTGRAADWFAGRAPRERVILGVGGAVLLAAMFVTLIWRPLVATRAMAIQRLEQEESLIAVMKGNETRLRALSATAPIARAAPAATAITQEAALQQITIQRLEKDGARIRVTVDNAEFPALIGWLNRLETAHGLRIAGLELERRPAPGVVSARVTLEE
jgi:general secretion pathway protein M